MTVPVPRLEEFAASSPEIANAVDCALDAAPC